MNLHLISFCSPIKNYAATRSRFFSQALGMETFKSINLFSEEDCFDYCSELLNHKEFMQTRYAYGLWIWKSFLISELMKLIPEDEVICYADMGCSFNIDGKKRMFEYYSFVMKNDSLCFELPYPEKKFTKLDTYFRVFPNNKDHLNTNQRCATAYFLKNNQTNRNIIEEFKSISVENDYHYIDNSDSIISNDEDFEIHRWDQSIFSLLSKKHDFYCIPDETYWHPNWHIDGKKYPIWATRIG